MSAARRLDPDSQARLLDLIGVARYVRRGPAPPVVPPVEAAVPARRSPTPAEAPPARSAPAPSLSTAPQEREPTARPSLLAELGLDVRTPQLLLFVESPRAPDPRGQLLLAAIRRLLPPHQMLDASDVPGAWLPHAIALGGRIAPPQDTSLHAAPALAMLRQDVSAKRALWRAIRRLRRIGAAP